MFKRPSFWLGLLLGLGAAFGLRCRRQPDPLLDLVDDAVLVCGASGAVTFANAAARRLFGADGQGNFRLCYPSGQPIPPGQFPLRRALKNRQSVTQAGYVLTLPDGQRRVLDVCAYPILNSPTASPLAPAPINPNSGRTGEKRNRDFLPFRLPRIGVGGLPNLTGAVAVFQDVTARQELERRQAATERHLHVLGALGLRLGAAAGIEELARSVVDSALALLDGLPAAQVKVYAYDSERKRLTLLASAPEDRPKRPKSLRQAQPSTVAFDAGDPVLWQVYVARQPFVGGASECALPLPAGGVVLGHLSVTCAAADVFGDTELLHALTHLAGLAALALAGRREAAQAADLGRQMKALGAIARCIAERQDRDTLADLVAKQLKQAVGCEVCTLAVGAGDGFRLAGAAYQEALLFPERYAPDNPLLLHSAAQEALKTGRTVLCAGLPNPDFQAGPWRAFAGQSGRHCVAAIPLAGGLGVLTVYAAGEAMFDSAQVRFLETLAVLIAPATTSADRLNS